MLFNHYKLHKFVFFVIMFKTDLEVFMIERGKEVGFGEVLLKNVCWLCRKGNRRYDSRDI